MIVLLNKKRTGIGIFDLISYHSFDFHKKDDIKKIYDTELLLVTNSTNQIEITCWLCWHLFVIKVDHVILVDNSDGFLENTAKRFGTQVEYIKSNGTLRQCDIYTKYVNSSRSRWVLPIDDDEYLYISARFNNSIKTFLQKNADPNIFKFAFNWRMFFRDNYNLPEKRPVYTQDDLYIKNAETVLSDCTYMTSLFPV